jgi:arylsulfatase A-like enzyme
MHGRSLVPQLEKPEDSWRRNLLMTFTGRHYGTDTDTIPTDTSVLRRVGGVSWYASLHDGRFKYIRTFEENEIEELYDLQTDPEELNNLASNDDHAAHLHTMRGQTVAELRRTDAGFVDALPKVRP